MRFLVASLISLRSRSALDTVTTDTFRSRATSFIRTVIAAIDSHDTLGFHQSSCLAVYNMEKILKEIGMNRRSFHRVLAGAAALRTFRGEEPGHYQPTWESIGTHTVPAW